MMGELALGVGCCSASVERALEHAEERVALGSQLAPVAGAKRRAQDLVVLDLGLDVRVAELLHQPGRALYVGEEKGDGAAGEAHCAEPVSARSEACLTRLSTS